MSEDCVFCKIDRGEIPSEVIFRNERCFVIRDIAPKAPVHLLIIPSGHFTYLTGMTPEFAPTAADMLDAARCVAEQEGVTDAGYRLVINQGGNAGQEVPHLHMHLLGGKQLGGMG
ncbi:MAG: histidine triad nucleotide-binding protein [Chloroflexi bacterium]|nr:histidine triad nucleotide-binding protein [Chloroflexota bacterium]MCH9009679.1 histidine triad nucleotide-binding protein [Chloroflexota bacterium]